MMLEHTLKEGQKAANPRAIMISKFYNLKAIEEFWKSFSKNSPNISIHTQAINVSAKLLNFLDI